MNRSKVLLLIDDDADDRDLFDEALAEVDKTCILQCASNGDSAISSLQSGLFKKPDYIFLDINMPGKNGWQCLEEIRKMEHLKHVPVIIYTTSQISDRVSVADADPHLFFITKPSKFYLIKEAIRLVTHDEFDELGSLNRKFPRPISTDHQARSAGSNVQDFNES